MSDYAIIETGSKQYRVEPQSVLDVELLNIEVGQKEVTLDKVLFVRSGDDVKIGAPHVEKAKVVCDYLGEVRGQKVISFKIRRRKDSQRKQGHRQNYTRLKVKEIVA